MRGHVTRAERPANQMPSMVDPAELMATSDVATYFGVSRQVVANWKKRHPDFPPPVVSVAGGMTDLYLFPAVEAYGAKRGHQTP